MDQLQHLLHSEEVVPLQLLSELGRKSLRNSLQDGPSMPSLSSLQQIWWKLQQTACDPSVIDKHLTAACNVVCVFMRCICQSSIQQVREYAYSKQLWFEGWKVVHKAFNEGKHKPAGLVLDTLVQILQDDQDKERACDILQNAINQNLKTVFTGQPRISLKEACITLSCFVRKTHNMIPVGKYFQSVGPSVEAAFQKRCLQAKLNYSHVKDDPQRLLADFFMALLLTASQREPRTVAIKLFSLLCSKHEKIDLLENIHIASTVIEVYLRANDEALKEFSVDVFPAVLSDEVQFSKFLIQFDPSDEFSLSRLSIFLAILQVGRQKSFVSETELPAVLGDALSNKMASPVGGKLISEGFGSCLMCEAPIIRLQAFSLLTSSTATTASIPLHVLDCLENCFQYLHNDSDSSYRDEFISIARRLLLRLEGSRKVAGRLESTVANQSAEILTTYSSFLRKWILFLCTDLLPQASYQRHILALQTLHLITFTAPASIEPILSSVTANTLILALLNLVFDAYDDVRSRAADLLIRVQLFAHNAFITAFQDLQVLQIGKKMSASTNRADHADALGRLMMLQAYSAQQLSSVPICNAERIDKHSVSMHDIVATVEEHLQPVESLSPLSAFPLHGSLLGIAYVLRSQRQYLNEHDLDRTLNICGRIWLLVQKDLCIDSPETEADETEEISNTGPKDVLAYSWRALRDSSLVMQALLDTQPPCASLHNRIGGLCFEQLKALRHRGAFSAVAQTFQLCCQEFRNTKHDNVDDLSQVLLEAAFLEIKDQSAKLTRRSAGLPSIFAALLDPTNSKQFLDGVYRLVQIANVPPEFETSADIADMRLPQVHALNCLKDIMLNSRFRSITEPLVVEMLNLSANSLGSSIWAIRNCGLMLFRACINRLMHDTSSIHGMFSNSATEVKTPLKVAVDLLLEQHSASGVSGGDDNLRAPTKNGQIEIVFAALDLLSQIPSQRDTDELINDLVERQFCSKLWTVRERAARLRATRRSDRASALEFLTALNMDTDATSNERHGSLLCCQYIFQQDWTQWSSSEKQSRVHRITTEARKHYDNLSAAHTSPVVQAACVDLINCVYASVLAEGDVDNIVFDPMDLADNDSENGARNTGFYLLDRAKCLNRALSQVRNATVNIHSETDLTSVPGLSEATMGDPDIAIYTITELTEKVGASHSAELITILLQTIEPYKLPQVKTATFTGIAKCKAYTCPTITSNQVLALFQAINLRSSHDRDLWNSQVRVAAFLARICLEQGRSLDRIFLDDLIAALRISQQDEVELLTRLSAVEALDELCDYMQSEQQGQDCKITLTGVRLCLVLYDFLNDDNENIRSIAAATAYKVLQRRQELKDVVSGCATAAREAMIMYILQRVRSPTLLIASACMRIIGAPDITGTAEIECLGRFCQTKPVEEALTRAVQSATDLFAVERQNLYVDDIAEVEAWSKVFERHSLHDLEASDIARLLAWTIDGLSSLLKLMNGQLAVLDTDVEMTHTQGQNGVVHPLGSTYNAEILIIFVRVITMAGLLRSTRGRHKGNLGIWDTHKEQVTDQLHKLRTIAVHHRVHERVLTAIDYSLNIPTQ